MRRVKEQIIRIKEITDTGLPTHYVKYYSLEAVLNTFAACTAGSSAPLPHHCATDTS
jgi:hypothetical protein